MKPLTKEEWVAREIRLLETTTNWLYVWFGNDRAKVRKWFYTKNDKLHDQIPMQYVHAGRYRALRYFILSCFKDGLI